MEWSFKPAQHSSSRLIANDADAYIHGAHRGGRRAAHHINLCAAHRTAHCAANRTAHRGNHCRAFSATSRDDAYTGGIAAEGDAASRRADAAASCRPWTAFVGRIASSGHGANTRICCASGSCRYSRRTYFRKREWTADSCGTDDPIYARPSTHSRHTDE